MVKIPNPVQSKKALHHQLEQYLKDYSDCYHREGLELESQAWDLLLEFPWEESDYPLHKIVECLVQDSSTIISAELNSYVDYGTAYQYYTTTDVNLRAQPGTDSSVVNSLGGGTAVSVIGETDNWFVVSVNGATGYISKSYISSSDTSTSTGGTTSDTSGSTGNTGSSTTTGTGTISGTITSASATSVTVQGDDGNTYVINTSDASLSTADGIYEGLYISATVDYSNTSPSGELYATSVTGN